MHSKSQRILSPGKIGQEQSNAHGQEANSPKLRIRHILYLCQPSLHPSRECEIGQALYNQKEPEECDQEFHTAYPFSSVTGSGCRLRQCLKFSIVRNCRYWTPAGRKSFAVNQKNRALHRLLQRCGSFWILVGWLAAVNQHSMQADILLDL